MHSRGLTKDLVVEWALPLSRAEQSILAPFRVTLVPSTCQTPPDNAWGRGLHPLRTVGVSARESFWESPGCPSIPLTTACLGIQLWPLGSEGKESVQQEVLVLREGL